MLEKNDRHESRSQPPFPAALEVNRNAWERACKKYFDPKTEVPLDVKLDRALTLFERSFGAQAEGRWTSEEQRSRKILIFIKAVGEKIYQEAVAVRAENPQAKAFLDRMDTEVRRLIPGLTLEDKVSLFRSGYPMGTGEHSLTQLCIASEQLSRGYRGVVLLFAQSRHEGDSERAWSEDIFRAASAVLGKAPASSIPEYVKGLKRMFAVPSSWVPRAQELFESISESIALAPLLETYNRTRTSDHFPEALKRALLSTIASQVDRATGGHLQDDLRALKASGDLPQIGLKLVPLIQTIERITAEGGVGSTKPLNDVKAILRECQTSETSRQAVLKEAVSGEDSLKAQDRSVNIADSLTILTGEKLRLYLSYIVETGLQDPTSDLSQEFLRALEDATIDKLIVVRAVLSSSEDIPATHLETIEREIQRRLVDVIPTLSAVELADVYKVFVEVSAPPGELEIMREALRARFGLPQQDHTKEVQKLSAAGLIVWRWMFNELPPDSALLAHIVGTRFQKIMSRLAYSVAPETTRELAIEAALHYAAELGLLQNYKPDPQMLGLPVWQLVIFTALVRERFGKESSIATTLTDAICRRLMTEDVKRRDFFPQVWAHSENIKSVEALCSDMRARISEEPRTFEERALLFANAKLLERRGPRQFNLLYESLRRPFTRELPEMDVSMLKGDGPQMLRRSVQMLAAARYRSLALTEPLSHECVRYAELFSPEEIATLAEAFATLRAGSPEFWSMVASRLERDWGLFTNDTLISVVWSLVLEAPEKVPERLDSFVWLNVDGIRSAEKVAQSLIALGRYRPQPGDRGYARLLQSQISNPPDQFEVEFENDLPGLLALPKGRIYSKVVVAGFETDWIADYGHRRLIVELDGLGHFLVGPDGGMLQGRDAFQDKVFKELGYEVIHVPHLGRRIGRETLNELRATGASLALEALDPRTTRRRYVEPLIANT